MKLKTAISLTAFLLFIFGSTASAQDATTPNVNQPNQAPTGGNLNEENAAPGGTVAQDDEGGFNPLWLLPLLLLPLLYFMLKKDDREDQAADVRSERRYETAYHDVDRDEDEDDDKGRGWYDDSEGHSEAAKKGSSRDR